MFGLKEFSADFLSSVPWLIWIAMLGLLALTFLLYYRTNPTIPTYLRVLLAGLRAIAVLALVLALFEPVISYRREHARTRRVSVLVDNSGSMDKVELGKSRKARVDSLLSSSDFSQLRANADVSVHYFGTNLASSADQVRRDGTGIGEAAYMLSSAEATAPADNWLLLSDGRSNSGRAPALAVTGGRTPISAVAMSRDLGGFDVSLENVDFNPVIFAGQPTEIKTTISWQGGKGKTTTVRLMDGSREVAESVFPLSEESGKGDIVLKYVPDQPGQKLLKINLPTIEGEENEGNNGKTISVKVLKSKIQVLMVTSTPDYEIGFLRRHLLQEDKYEVDLRALGTKSGNLAGRFPVSQTELNRFDLVILYDPDPQSLSAYQQSINSYLLDRGGAVWVLLGDQFAARGPVEWFNRLLPFTQSIRRPVEYLEFHGEPSEENLFHPVIKLADDRTTIRELWNSLPPFKSLVRCDLVDKSSQILAYVAQSGRSDLRTPILGFKRFGPGKLLASAALPFWSWGFQSIGFGGDDSAYVKLVEGTTRWLTVKDDFDPIRIAPESDVFTRGRPVVFLGYAFDQGYRPIDGVTGSVVLKNDARGTDNSTDLIPKGEGKYEADFDLLPPGTYAYKGTMSRDGKELKRSEGSIVIEPFSLEEYDQSGDPTTLMAMAKVSGGDFYTIDGFSEAIRKINGGGVSESTSGEFVLWNQGWLLALFILCLTVEWFLRKLNQLL
jgi:hypothetical protein